MNERHACASCAHPGLVIVLRVLFVNGSAYALWPGQHQPSVMLACLAFSARACASILWLVGPAQRHAAFAHLAHHKPACGRHMSAGCLINVYCSVMQDVGGGR